MGFLNNSGDIILDAVLTDTGRLRLARGSFSINKFALADDEIDYSLFDGTSPSAQQDTSILQTPVFEAFTNNASVMKNRLLSINLADLLYLPVLKVNDYQTRAFANTLTANGYLVAVDTATETALLGGTVGSTSVSPAKVGANGPNLTGVIKGASIAASGLQIKVDQGIDNVGQTTLTSDLEETQYLVEIDSRFGVIVKTDRSLAQPSFTDDDLIASYAFIKDEASSGVTKNTSTEVLNAGRVIAGGLGTTFTFSIGASQSLTSSPFFFNTLGTTITSISFTGSGTLRGILSSINVIGGTTGYSLNIPIVYLKLV